MFPIFGQQNEKFGLGMDSSSSDEPIKYAPNRLGIALIAGGLVGLVLSVYEIYPMGHWQGIWV
jgi:hypothetical protein